MQQLIEILLGFGFLWAAFLIWEQLSKSTLGRAIQVTIVVPIYAAWLSIYPFAVVVCISAAIEAHREESSVGMLIAIASIFLMLPLGLFALIPWNFFCKWVWIKIGLCLPQTEHLGGFSDYRRDSYGERI